MVVFPPRKCFNINVSPLAMVPFAADVELVFGTVYKVFDIVAVGKNHQQRAEKPQNALKPRVVECPDADGQEHNTCDSAKRNVLREYDDHEEYDPADKPHAPVYHPCESSHAQNSLTAVEMIIYGVNMTEHCAEACEEHANHCETDHSEQPATNHNSRDGFQNVNDDYYSCALNAKSTREVCKPRVSTAKMADVFIKKVHRGNNRAINSAKKIGDNARDYQENRYLCHYSVSPFCLMVMRMGVPSNPKTLLI